jgi:hypothetical protein
MAEKTVEGEEGAPRAANGEPPASAHGAPPEETPKDEAHEAKTPSLRMLADRPLEDETEDRLDFKHYANALAELIDHRATHTPLTIALSAPWGAGKTSLAKLVQKRLAASRVESGRQPHVACWFNAWAHDDADHLGAAFAAEVARVVDRERSWWRRLRAPLPTAMLTPRDRWRRRTRLAGVAFGAAVAVAIAPGAGDLLGDASLESELDAAFGARLASVLVLLLTVLAVWRKLFAATESTARFVDDPRSEAARGSMNEVRGELGRLIADATQGERRIVVFVDDLERCRPPRALEVCEVAANLLGHPEVVTVLIADMGVIAASAELKYRPLESSELGPNRTPGAYGRLYLQKIVQIQFDLPTATSERVTAILVEEAQTGPAPSPEQRPVERARWTLLRERLENEVGPALMLVVAVGLGAYFAIRPPDSAGGDRGGAFVMGAFAGGLGVVLLVLLVRSAARVVTRIYRTVSSRRARLRLTAIDDRIWTLANPRVDRAAIAALLAGGPADPAEFIAQVETQYGEESPEAVLARRRAVRYLTEESPVRQEADAQVVRYLPLVPRSAKRMMNHLRLRLYVAIDRGLIGGGSEVEPAHIGKWVVLEERWPELARAVKERPAILLELERTADLGAALAKLGLESTLSDDLAQFVEAEPTLGPLAQRLIYLEPASTTPRG